MLCLVPVVVKKQEKSSSLVEMDVECTDTLTLYTAMMERERKETWYGLFTDKVFSEKEDGKSQPNLVHCSSTEE